MFGKTEENMSVNKNPDIVAIGHLCMDRIFLCEHMPQENTSAHIVSDRKSVV